MSSPEYPRKGDGWRKAGWILLFAAIGLAALAIGVGAVAAVERLVTA